MENIEKEYNKHKNKYLSHVKEEILEMVQEAEQNGIRIPKEKANQRMNSYERNLLRPYLTDEHLIETIEYHLLQSGEEFRRTGKYTIDGTYNDSLKHKFIHILLDRFKEKIIKSDIKNEN